MFTVFRYRSGKLQTYWTSLDDSLVYITAVVVELMLTWHWVEDKRKRRDGRQWLKQDQVALEIAGMRIDIDLSALPGR